MTKKTKLVVLFLCNIKRNNIVKTNCTTSFKIDLSYVFIFVKSKISLLCYLNFSF